MLKHILSARVGTHPAVYMNQIGFHSSKLGHRTSIFSSTNGITICSKINELEPHLALLKQVEVKVLEPGPKSLYEV